MSIRTATFASVRELAKFLTDNGLGKEDILWHRNMSGHFDIMFDSGAGAGGGSSALHYDAGVVNGATGVVTISVVATAKTFTRSAGSFLTDGFRVGDLVTFTGLANGGNSGTFVATTVTALVITCAAATGLADETGDADETATAVGHYVYLNSLARLRVVRVSGIGGTTTLNMLNGGDVTILNGDTFEMDWEGFYLGDGTTTAANLIAIGPDSSYLVSWIDRS